VVREFMGAVNIEGVVHLCSRERWACLLGGICVIFSGLAIAYCVFKYIPIYIAIPHCCVVLIASISIAGGISLILLAIHPTKIYWVQELLDYIMR